MDAPRYIAVYAFGEWHVRDTKHGFNCAGGFTTQGSQTGKTFAQHIADCFNDGNMTVIERFMTRRGRDVL